MAQESPILPQTAAARPDAFALSEQIRRAHAPRLAKIFLKTLSGLRSGTLHLTTPEGEQFHFAGAEPGPDATFFLHDWRVISRLITRGDVGFAEDYMEGRWETGDLPALLTLATANIDRLEAFFHGRWWYRIVIVFQHMLRANSKRGSKKNIRAHYDLGNDFYALWLDKTMTYSSALFEHPEQTLEEGQKAKYRRILERLGAKPGDHILEVGCGWGGFAEIAAEQGCRVTAITLSKAQEAYARARLAAKGVADSVRLCLTDYRDLKESFDHIVSIEMFEAVGRKYWPNYFTMIRNCLKKGGKAIIQTITIDDHIFEDYASRSDFIQQYTFPGGMLPSLSVFRQEAEQVGLKLKETFTFGQDYARTLAHWLHDFDRARSRITEMGYSPTFQRMWRFYLSYCIAGFATRRTNVMQAELVHA